VPFLKKYPSFYGYSNDGTFDGELQSKRDIISRYQEPIDEEKLNELANEYIIKVQWENPELFKRVQNIYNAYKAGYRKAMEE